MERQKPKLFNTNITYTAATNTNNFNTNINNAFINPFTKVNIAPRNNNTNNTNNNNAFLNPFTRVNNNTNNIDNNNAIINPFTKVYLTPGNNNTYSTNNNNANINPFTNVNLTPRNNNTNSTNTNNPNVNIIIPRKMDDRLHFNTVYSHLQSKANLAAVTQKIFTVYGNYPSIRKELIKRGWLERCAPTRLKKYQDLPMTTLLTNSSPGNDYEAMALSKLMEHFHSKFCWIPKRSKCQTKGYLLPYVNHIKRNNTLDFTTKDGLIGCIESAHWNIMDGLSEINVPRYHRLRQNSEHMEFLEDYRTTYCLSLLEYIREANDIDEIFHVCGTIPIKVIDFALAKIKADIVDRETDTKDDEDEDEDEKENNETKKLISEFDMDWMAFYYNVNHLVNKRDKIQLTCRKYDILNILLDCKLVMRQADKYWPQIKSDGYNNLWIIKPAFACRGWGITIKNDFENILRFVGRRNKIRYIVQKYIERPLLIYNTKFDIRQYILLTITETRFNIWMYKDCYLRFSSQEYKLTNLNESVHITNNAVQRKYKNGVRSRELPTHNMWTLQQFKTYLKDSGYVDVWQKKIYPGMKKNITAIILSSLEETEITPNLFEIYGCDFMLTENYEPILIEINSQPDLSSSTIVTATLCPKALTDLVKVVVDLPKNRKAETGNFELIHSVVYTPVTATTLNNLEVVGKKFKKLK